MFRTLLMLSGLAGLLAEPAGAQPAGPGREAPFTENAASQNAAGRVVRPADRRPVRNEALAESLGIHKYVSRRLVLFTDLDPAVARTLPPLIDQAYVAWTDYFGELPPEPGGADFQITGYLMVDERRFIEAGLEPAGFVMAKFGRQVGREFWMHDQPSDYYRRHLLIHESTHAFMTVMPRVLPPLWYLEGMAELFGTHTLDQNGQVTFGVMPDAPENFQGLGRIELIQQENYYGRERDLHHLGSLTPNDFITPRPVPYAWSWAICYFLDHHPRYQARFRRLGRNLEGPEFQRLLAELFAPDQRLLSAEWHEFTRRLEYGDQVEHAAFVPAAVTQVNPKLPVTVQVSSQAGWQQTGLAVDASQSVTVHAAGSVVLDPGPPEWISDPNGITVNYAGGFPLGTLLLGWLPEDGDAVLQVSAVGPAKTVTLPGPGTIWLRINDTASNLGNNTGSYEVTLSCLPGP
jgi:hypothetical protein